MSESPNTYPNEEAQRFKPFSVRALPVPGQVIFFFCILVNIYAGWHFYSPTLDNGWGDWDDHTWRRDAERRNTFSTMFDPFLRTGHEAMDTSYVPVQSVLYHLSINVFDQGPWPIRVFGIWVHIINSLLLLVLAYRFFGSIPGAHIASLLFMLYPRNASTIGWLCASLAHGLVLTLYLSAFLLMQTYFHRRGRWRIVIAPVLFLLAILTKELSATLVAAIFLYDALIVVGWENIWRRPIPYKTYLGLLARSAPFIVILVAAIVIQSMKYDTGFVATKFGGMQFGARNPIRLLELSTLFFYWGPAWTREQVLLAMLGIYVALMTGIWVTRKKPEILFLIVWIPIILTPFTISNFRNATSLGRYLYEASAIFAVLLSLLAVRLVRWKPVLLWPMTCGAFLAVGSFAATVMRMLS